MKKDMNKKQIPATVVSRGVEKYGHHSVHQCDMARQLGRPAKPVKPSDERTEDEFPGGPNSGISHKADLIA